MDQTANKADGPSATCGPIITCPDLPIISTFGNCDLYSMHMPGHCGNNATTPTLNAILQTLGGNKVEGTTDDYFGCLGNYFPPSGLVEKSLQQTAEIYGTKYTWYGINGSTGNLISATRALGGKHQVALLQRNTHRSVAHGFRMSGAQLRFVVPDYDDNFVLFKPLTLEKIKAEVEKPADPLHPQITVVCVTTPTYEGFAADIPAIAAYCKEKGLKLLIDGAHGSIFPFHKLMPPSGIGIDGVDIVVQSMHKAAGAFSQTSVIHLNKGSALHQKTLETALHLTASTSPSSLLLGSLEETVRNIRSPDGQAMLDRAIGFANNARAHIKTLCKFKLWDIEGFQVDPTKICFSVTGYEGKHIDVRGCLRSKKIDPEAFTPGSVLLAFHIGTTEDTYNAFIKAVDYIQNKPIEKVLMRSARIPRSAVPYHTQAAPEYTLEYKYALDEVFEKPIKKVEITQAIGKVAAQMISPCPPGIIVVDIGAIIQDWITQFVKEGEEVWIIDE